MLFVKPLSLRLQRLLRPAGGVVSALKCPGYLAAGRAEQRPLNNTLARLVDTSKLFNNRLATLLLLDVINCKCALQVALALCSQTPSAA